MGWRERSIRWVGENGSSQWVCWNGSYLFADVLAENADRQRLRSLGQDLQVFHILLLPQALNPNSAFSVTPFDIRIKTCGLRDCEVSIRRQQVCQTTFFRAGSNQRHSINWISGMDGMKLVKALHLFQPVTPVCARPWQVPRFQIP